MDVDGRDADEFAYLEDVRIDRARAWIETQNARTTDQLQSDPRFGDFYQAALENNKAAGDLKGTRFGIADANALTRNGDWVYQIWSDAAHPRGIWRRTPLKTFLANAPEWQTLLDIDLLAAAEKRPWVLVNTYFSPSGQHCLMQLSVGGAQTSEFREYDLTRGAFADRGFRFPEGYTNIVAWRDDDALLFNSNLTWSDSRSSVPDVVKQLERGQSLSEASEILRANADDIYVGINIWDAMSGSVAERGRRVMTLYKPSRSGEGEYWQLDRQGRTERLNLSPTASSPLLHRGHYVFRTLRDWTISGVTWKAGTLLSVAAAEATGPAPKVSLVLEAVSDVSIKATYRAGEGLLVTEFSAGAWVLWRLQRLDGQWVKSAVPLPPHGTINAVLAEEGSDTAMVMFESFLQPPTLFRLDVAANRSTVLAGSAAKVDGSDFVTEQLEAVSKDGARVPYFIVRSKALKHDGRAPVLVHGYGAFGWAQSPEYSGTRVELWLARQQGVYVVANVRGGTERGQSWYVRGLERQHTYDDMLAVVEDLIRRKVTSAKRVAVTGTSAGGLLGAVMITQRPDLFGGAVLQVPVLDQFRPDLLFRSEAAVASEYGSTRVPAEREFLLRTSPFQNLQKNADFPAPFIVTSATDEHVSPAQSRRFAARMQALDLPFLFFEQAEGGHGGSASLVERARLEALIYTYLTRQLIDSNESHE